MSNFEYETADAEAESEHQDEKAWVEEQENREEDDDRVLFSDYDAEDGASDEDDKTNAGDKLIGENADEDSGDGPVPYNELY